MPLPESHSLKATAACRRTAAVRTGRAAACKRPARGRPL